MSELLNCSIKIKSQPFVLGAGSLFGPEAASLRAPSSWGRPFAPEPSSVIASRAVCRCHALLSITNQISPYKARLRTVRLAKFTDIRSLFLLIFLARFIVVAAMRAAECFSLFLHAVFTILFTAVGTVCFSFHAWILHLLFRADVSLKDSIAQRDAKESILVTSEYEWENKRNDDRDDDDDSDDFLHGMTLSAVCVSRFFAWVRETWRSA